MELQVALDCELDVAVSLMMRLQGAVDRAEIGTPLLLREGLHAVRRLREAVPGLPLTADAKIMDAGEMEADICAASGCDIVTALAVASDETLAGAARACHRHGARLMVDMIAAPEPVARAERLWALGADIVCVHTGFDVQGLDEGPLGVLAQMRNAFPDRAIAVAGGLGGATLGPVLPLRPQIVIVGGAILNASDPLAVATDLKQRIEAND